MSRDVKFINACDHIVNDKTYDIQTCPKCYGKGYYFDIYFDTEGKAVTSEDEVKLQQEILKVIIDHKYDNLFHQKWGSQLHSLIGSKNNTITKNKIKVLARQAEEYLQNIQQVEHNENYTLNEKEMIEDVISVDVKSIDPTGYLVTVMIKSKANEVYEQSLQI